MNDGILDKEYINKRKKGTYFHRLKRRAFEVCYIIKEHYVTKSNISLLDLGCAEGALFDLTKLFLPDLSIDYTGIEYSISCLINSQDDKKAFINSDINKLPLKKGVRFDVIVMTAVLEHISRPKILLSKLSDHLNENGIIIITMPDPFFEKIASFLGNIEESESGHHNPINRNELKNIIKDIDLYMDKFKKFMITPWGFIFENKIERIYPDILLLNQLFVLKKK
ncbi:MAG: hypothetical protein C0601_01365 [Candidatus Muiribacterium halophilum]|uniref:Methyltransferase domain-containing protein n=1 Tax=Muiribacterium halophilum TaxID=2053465 RepID=A0A2N5ZLQ9_MUIH1|nr:MAG: hypothetical protein C0601_01365 [Candidatus Muirbacterium halophilum]